MEDMAYYLFCAMTLLGALGVLTVRGYVNAAMSMLLSMLGAAGLLVLMKAYFLAFIMVSVYAGAVLVLFVFVVMLMGDGTDNSSVYKKFGLLAVWVLAGMAFAFFQADLARYSNSANDGVEVLSSAKNYGLGMLTTFMLPFQIAGALLLAAIVGVIAIAKMPSKKHRNESI